MKSALLPLFGFIFALMGLGAAAYFWRRASSLYALLVEGASRFEELRQRASGTDQELRNANERLLQNREAMMRMEKNIDESRARVAAMSKQLEAKEQEQEHVKEKLELQKNHLMKQLESSNMRLETTIIAKNEAEERVAQISRQADERLHLQINELRMANQQLRQQLGTAEQRAQKAEHAVQNVNTDEVRLLKRKLAQFERLYASMKGLRELADERNRNLETAARKLAIHTIQAHSLDAAAAIPTTLGPLVGGALELIGAELIDDAEAVDFSGAVDAQEVVDAEEQQSSL